MHDQGYSKSGVKEIYLFGSYARGEAKSELRNYKNLLVEA
ncbi:MAG: nucleotidyltransferase domain-containing protein [Dorea sp.]|nr:nucleotidyltransferase domain-containing protein [Dorea sp.]